MRLDRERLARALKRYANGRTRLVLPVSRLSEIAGAIADAYEATTESEGREVYLSSSRLSPPAAEQLRVAAREARDLIANYLWNEDDSGDENDLHAAYEGLRALLGPSTEDSVGQTITAVYEATTQTGTDGPVPGSSAPAPAAECHPGGPTASGA